MINKNTMSYPDAAKILGVKTTDDMRVIDRAYKRASLKAHPDRGGSTEAMQKINAAYKALKDSADARATVKSSRAESEQMRKNAEERMNAYFDVVKTYFKTRFNSDAFAQYITSYTKQPTQVTHVIKESYYGTIVGGYSFKSGDAVFEFKFTSRLPASNGLASPNRTIDNISTDVYVVVGAKRHKMARREYKWGQNPETLKPEDLFPSDKMKKIFDVKNKGNIGAKFKRADYIAALTRQVHAKWDGKKFRIPVTKQLNNGMYAVVLRSTVMGKGLYDFGGVFGAKGGRALAYTSITLPEKENGSTLDAMLDMFTELQKQDLTADGVAMAIKQLGVDYAAGKMSPSFIKRIAAQEEAKQARDEDAASKKPRASNRVKKEDYLNMFRSLGAKVTAYDIRLELAPSMELYIDRVVKDRKASYVLKYLSSDLDGKPGRIVRPKHESSIPEMTDGSTLEPMREMLQKLKGHTDREYIESVFKQFADNVNAGKYVAPSVKRAVAATNTPNSSDLGSQPTKPTQAKSTIDPKVKERDELVTKIADVIKVLELAKSTQNIDSMKRMLKTAANTLTKSI